MRRKPSARAIAALRRITADPTPWTGPVERRQPATYQQRSFIAFWKCANPYCGEWTPAGSRAAGRCLVCHTPKPSDV